MNIEYYLNRIATNNYRNLIARRFRKGKVLPPPTFVLWDCTRRCNLNCKFCGASAEKYQDELTKDKLFKIINESAQIGVRTFSVTGGEPLLRPDLLEILNYANQKGLKTSIASNGFLINKKMANQIKEAGVTSIQLSLDGVEHTHNAIRQNNQSFSRVIRAIRNLQNVGIPTLQIATTVIQDSFNQLASLRDLLLDLNIKLWRLGMVMPIGRAKNANMSIKKSQVRKLLTFVKENNSDSLRIIIGENLPFLGEFETDIRTEPILCPAGITALCIGVNGNIRGCAEQPDIPKFIEGSLREDSLAKIWQNGFKRYRLQTILCKDARCNNCKDKKRCLGGCWVMREKGQQCIHDWL